jgi:DNA-binding NtrC family response regulator
VRELKNVMERAVVLAKTRIVSEKDFPVEITSTRTDGCGLEVTLPLREMQLRAVKAVLERCGGNKSQAALLLGVSRKALYKRIRDYQLG